MWILKTCEICSSLSYCCGEASIQSTQPSVQKFVKQCVLNALQELFYILMFQAFCFCLTLRSLQSCLLFSPFERSVDRMIVELCHSLLSADFQDAPSVVLKFSLLLNHRFLTSIPPFKSKGRSSLCSSHVNYWNPTLEPVTVHYIDILEQNCPWWKDYRCTVYLKQATFFLIASQL